MAWQRLSLCYAAMDASQTGVFMGHGQPSISIIDGHVFDFVHPIRPTMMDKMDIDIIVCV